MGRRGENSATGDLPENLTLRASINDHLRSAAGGLFFTMALETLTRTLGTVLCVTEKTAWLVFSGSMYLDPHGGMLQPWPPPPC